MKYILFLLLSVGCNPPAADILETSDPTKSIFEIVARSDFGPLGRLYKIADKQSGDTLYLMLLNGRPSLQIKKP